jgi:protein involved in polysaccharide export with SLBB domain
MPTTPMRDPSSRRMRPSTLGRWLRWAALGLARGGLARGGLAAGGLAAGGLAAGGLAAGGLAAGLLAVCVLGAPATTSAQQAGGALPPASSADGRTGEVLRVGDQVIVQVWRQPEFTGEFFVTERGGLSHPLLQQVIAHRRTPDELRSSLELFLSQYESEPSFVVEAFYRVIIGGEVRTPGVTYIRAGSVITDALILAGGPLERGDLTRVILRRDGQDYVGDLRSPTSQFRGIVLHSGDEIILERDRRFFQDYVRPTVTFVGSLSSIAWIIIQALDRR